MSYLTEKLSKQRSFDRQWCRAQNCFASRLSHRELSSSLRESHSFLSLPADTTMTSSQGTQKTLKKLTNLMETCAVPAVQFIVQFFIHS
jgi:hypothetical protein